MKHRLSTLHAFTLLELLATVGIIACLTGIATPVIAKVRTKAETVSCAENLRQIGIASQLYASDNDQNFPRIEVWP